MDHTIQEAHDKTIAVLDDLLARLAKLEQAVAALNTAITFLQLARSSDRAE